jgi:hypothetical protein
VLSNELVTEKARDMVMLKCIIIVCGLLMGLLVLENYLPKVIHINYATMKERNKYPLALCDLTACTGTVLPLPSFIML